MNVDDPFPRVTTSSTVEQAQGVVMACYGCDPSAALAILSRVSCSRDVGLRDLAAAVVGAAVRRSDSSHGLALSPCEQVRLVLGDVPEHGA